MTITTFEDAELQYRKGVNALALEVPQSVWIGFKQLSDEYVAHLKSNEAVGKLVSMVLHIAPELNGTCDQPNEVYPGEWSRCGGCMPCTLDQLHSAAKTVEQRSGDSNG